ncbi:ribonuclease P protein component [Candidatus Halobeggiatoa sp. HSG11]|nr:ribonuclease P protein component [Candidatus Halobeggiatoa sp. HSG11]
MHNKPCQFTRQQRLLKARDYQFVFAKPYTSSDRYLTVLAREKKLPFARLGLAITKKRIKLAVARNRLKRLIRESFRQQQIANLDYVVLAKSDAYQADNNILLNSLAKHWHKLSRQCKKS